MGLVDGTVATDSRGSAGATIKVSPSIDATIVGLIIPVNARPRFTRRLMVRQFEVNDQSNVDSRTVGLVMPCAICLLVLGMDRFSAKRVLSMKWPRPRFGRDRA